MLPGDTSCPYVIFLYQSRVRAGLLEQRHEQELQDDAQQQRLRVEVSVEHHRELRQLSSTSQSLVVGFKSLFGLFVSLRNLIAYATSPESILRRLATNSGKNPGNYPQKFSNDCFEISYPNKH